MGSKGGSPPAAPNYKELIPLQEGSNLRQFQTMLNASRVNQVTPYGTQTWTQGPAPADGRQRIPESGGSFLGNRSDLAPQQLTSRVGQAADLIQGRDPFSGDPIGQTYDSLNGTWQEPYRGYGEPSNGGQAAPEDPYAGWGAGPSNTYGADQPWTYTQTLSPEQQQLYNANVSSQLQQAGLLEALTGRVGQTLGQGLDLSSLPGLQGGISPTIGQQSFNNAEGVTPGAIPGAPGMTIRDRLASILNPLSDFSAPGSTVGDRFGQAQDVTGRLEGINPGQINQDMTDAVYRQATRYALPQRDTEQRALESRLGEQGFVPGTPAYAQAMQEFQQSKDRSLADARDRAIMSGFDVGNQNIQQQLSIANAIAGNSLNRARLGLDQDALSFNQQLAGRQLGAQLQNQGFNQSLGRAQFGQGQDQAAFNQALAGAQYGLGAQGQQFGQQVSQAGLRRQDQMDANQVANQLFGQQLQGAQFGNQARGQGLAEALALRALPFNELSAIRGGTQVQLPNNPAQYSTPNLQGVDMLGVANQDYQNQLGAYNAQTAGGNDLLGSLLGFGGMVLGGPFGGALGKMLGKGLGGGFSGVPGMGG